MNRVTITGQAGLVQWGYATAARLASWSLTTDDTGSTLTATVLNADDFRIAQAPLMFVVTRSTGTEWKWPIESLARSGNTVTATLGSQVVIVT